MNADLRRRLLIVVGASALPLAAPTLDSGGDQREGDGHARRETICVQGVFITECPDSSEVEEVNDDDFGRTVTPDPGPGELVNGECCYEVTIRQTGAIGCGCAHGRPVFRAARPLLAGLGASNWIDAKLAAPDLRGLSAAERSRLAGFWASVGAHEHSSIAAFHRTALELLNLGAPLALVSATQRAALDEARHARHAFTLASQFAGAKIGPGPLPLGASVELAPDLPAFAARTVTEGCVGETMSLLAAELMLAGARDVAVKRVLQALVRDERRHVELAWRTLRWTLDVGGKPVADTVSAAFSAARAPVPQDPEPLPARLGAWGAAADARLCEAASRGLTEVILPVAEHLAA